MTTIRVVMDGEPVPQNTGKIGKWKAKDGREGTTMRQPGHVVRYKKELAKRLRQEAARLGSLPLFPEKTPVALLITAVFPCPTSDHRKTRPRDRRRHVGRYGNCDNLTKAIGDAAEGILWVDDGQICDLRVIKWIGAQGEEPHVIIEASAIDAPAACPVLRMESAPDESGFVGALF